MASIHKLKKQSARRLALLGLAAAQSGPEGACLLPEEMAELVEERCPPATKERYLEHVAGCEACYREWLTLHESLESERRTQGKATIFWLRKPGRLAVFGTLLAAAASIVVFLNLDRNVAEKVVPVLEAPVSREMPASGLEKKHVGADIRPQEQRVTPEAQGGNGAESVSKQKGREKKRDMSSLGGAADAEKKQPAPAAPMPPPAPTSSAEEQPPVQRGLSAEHPESLREHAVRKSLQPQGQSTEMPMALQDGARTVADDVFGRWRNQLAQGCTQRQVTARFWIEMEQRGKELGATGALSVEEKVLHEKLMAAITAGGEKEHAERCQNILELLEKVEGR